MKLLHGRLSTLIDHPKKEWFLSHNQLGEWVQVVFEEGYFKINKLINREIPNLIFKSIDVAEVATYLAQNLLIMQLGDYSAGEVVKVGPNPHGIGPDQRGEIVYFYKIRRNDDYGCMVDFSDGRLGFGTPFVVDNLVKI